MATKKSTFKSAEVASSANTFEAELDLAINNVCASSPELKEILADELSSLRAKVLDAYKIHSEKAIQDKNKELEDSRQTIALMDRDINSLKTVVLRMAITQYGG